MYFYKVQYSYPTGINNERARGEEVYLAENCQEAADLCRDQFVHLEGMLVDRIWKENHGSWMAVNAWR